MDLVIYILKMAYCIAMVLLLFNLTIFVHEYGHFLLARWRKLRVDEFAIWFGPAIWEKTIGGVRCVLRSIPLGGYVKLPQLQPDDPIEGKSETPREQLPYAHPKDRLPTLFAGSVFNFLFAILIACVLWVTGIPVHRSVLDMTISYVPEKSVEERAGIKAGDKLVAVNGVKVSNWKEVMLETALGSYETATLSLERDGKLVTVQIIPAQHPVYKFRDLDLASSHSTILDEVIDGGAASAAGLRAKDKVLSFDGVPVIGVEQFVKLIHERPGKPCAIEVERDGKTLALTVTPKLDGEVGRIGVRPGMDATELTLIHPNPVQQIEDVILQMQKMFMALTQPKKTGIGADSLSGPLGIFVLLNDLVGTDIRLALSFLVLLNVNLAILNLLPIPVLDGGHIMFTLLEWVRKKPLNYKLMEAIQSTFVVLLLGFILYVTFNDGKRWARTKGWLQDKQTPAQQAPATPSPAPGK